MKYELTPTVTLYHADCRDVLRLLPDNSVDSVVTDPPYEIGFMGKAWDNRGIANDPVLWAEVLRVLKPGGHVAAFGASRGYHRMACAIEDAGFEIRDSLMWIYGTGFPKSQNVSLAIDKQSGAIGHLAKSFNMKGGGGRSDEFAENGRDFSVRHEPVTDAAHQWEGWGTALKPAFEPIVLARKPLSEGTVAANVLRWGTGALNIDGCRVTFEDDDTTASGARAGQGAGRETANNDGPAYGNKLSGVVAPPHALGRWPANVVHDGSDEVVGAFPDSKGAQGTVTGKEASTDERYILSGLSGNHAPRVPRGDSGSAARFFYSAKASKVDRAGSKHPTVKPVSLMQWLARLITPPGGTVLDPFAGSGTTGKAAQNEGFSIILCEREAEYVADIQRRFDYLPPPPGPLPVLPPCPVALPPCPVPL